MDESSSEGAAVKKTFKVTVLGDGSVGKSSVCNRFCKDFFAREYKQTLGLDFFSQSMNMPDKSEVVFNLFDIGGQSLQSKMLKTYAAGSDAVLLVYDLTSLESLESLVQWKKLSQLPDSCTCIMVGNKSDLATKRAVQGVHQERVALELGVKKQFNISALTGDRVQMMFVALAGLLTNQDVEKLMLEERKVVKAVVKEEDLKTASALNQQGTAIGKVQKQAYDVIKAEVAEGQNKPDVQNAPVKKRLCGGM
ncbi:Rab28/RabF [Hexamita inflata]|uniref:Rab28/RabF n=1 Tax=Hexamita inflata TaxID=28002 RepID=A0AA86P389_9EUKA|nr:Rab28/RabF [Hexamita inflata]CAI9930901.1 Rab28/RabF [Hexamita inflata]